MFYNGAVYYHVILFDSETLSPSVYMYAPNIYNAGNLDAMEFIDM